MRDERVIKSSEVNARRETLSDVGDSRPPSSSRPPATASCRYYSPNAEYHSKFETARSRPNSYAESAVRFIQSSIERRRAPGAKRRRSYEKKVTKTRIEKKKDTRGVDAFVY